MDPDPLHIAQHLRSVILHSIDTFNFRNAEFACERLLSLAPEDPDSVYLYALTLYHQRQYKAAYNQTSAALKNFGDHLGCGYIFARLCLELQKYKEGIYKLVSMTHLYNNTADTDPDASFDGGDTNKAGTAPDFFASAHQKQFYESHRLIYPDSSAIYHLLGQMYKAEGDVASSALNFQQALKYNVFDFEALQELAKLGLDVSVGKLYAVKTTPAIGVAQISAMNAVPGPKTSASTNSATTGDGDPVGVPNPFSTTPRQTGPLTDIATPRITAPAMPLAPLRRTHDLFPKPAKFGDAKSSVSAPRSISYIKSRGDEPTRSSLKRDSLSGFVPTVSERIDVTKDVEAADAYLRKLYLVFAKLYKSMCKYDCYKAIRMLESLPESEKDTPWVLSKLGRLHYEIVNYKQLKKFFVRLRQLNRTRLEDMEYYSTLLWHLHKKVELTFLANELHDIDDNSAITWCVMGNLFSLTREPDEAIRCFNKSISIDPKFTYAHTLKGHEYFGTDNYEKALDCFRVGLMLDPRHYNAYYGIGMVYINLGEFQKADYHFRKAVSINPINIILICCAGMVLEKLGKKSQALRQYELANKLQPLSALPIFKKAQLLFSMQQFPQALKQFELVKELAPNEASVHFLLGQLYNIKNDKFLAIREFTTALNLDPKGNYLIREAMEMLKDNN